MIVAIPFHFGEIFQHFGRTETFHIYEIDGNRIMQDTIISTNGKSHHEIVDVLLDADVDVIICGHMGEPMMNRCKKAGMEIYGGLEGDIEDIIEDYLNHELSFSFHIMPEKNYHLMS